MAVEQHPKYIVWRAALDHLIDAEQRYYMAVMEELSSSEVQVAGVVLNEAREKYRKITDLIG